MRPSISLPVQSYAIENRRAVFAVAPVGGLRRLSPASQTQVPVSNSGRQQAETMRVFFSFGQPIGRRQYSRGVRTSARAGAISCDLRIGDRSFRTGVIGTRRSRHGDTIRSCLLRANPDSGSAATDSRYSDVLLESNSQPTCTRYSGATRQSRNEAARIILDSIFSRDGAASTCNRAQVGGSKTLTRMFLWDGAIRGATSTRLVGWRHFQNRELCLISRR